MFQITLMVFYPFGVFLHSNRLALWLIVLIFRFCTLLFRRLTLFFNRILIVLNFLLFLRLTLGKPFLNLILLRPFSYLLCNFWLLTWIFLTNWLISCLFFTLLRNIFLGLRLQRLRITWLRSYLQNIFVCHLLAFVWDILVLHNFLIGFFLILFAVILN